MKIVDSAPCEDTRIVVLGHAASNAHTQVITCVIYMGAMGEDTAACETSSKEAC